MAFAILRMEKLKGGAIGRSGKHADRKQETPNADKEKLEDNIYIVGKREDDLRELVDAAIKEAGGKPRRDSVECIEFFIGASPEHFDKPTKTTDFIKKAEEYIETLSNRGFKFVKVVAHRDEKTPHVSAFAVPLDDKGRLNAKHHLGGYKIGGCRKRMAEYQDEYADTMKPLGLERGVRNSKADHIEIQDYYKRIKHYEQLALELKISKQNQSRSDELLRTTTRLLDQQMQNRTDISLREAATSFIKPERLLETSQGLAILKSDQLTKVMAIITPDNKAFAPTGEKIIDASSVMFLSTTTGKAVNTVLTEIESRYDGETRKKAARSYGDELAKDKSDVKERDFSQAEDEAKLAQRKFATVESIEITQGGKGVSI